jgi:hypothetical protein
MRRPNEPSALALSYSARIVAWRTMLTESESLQLAVEMERRAEEIVRARSSPAALALLDSQRP